MTRGEIEKVLYESKHGDILEYKGKDYSEKYIVGNGFHFWASEYNLSDDLTSIKKTGRVYSFEEIKKLTEQIYRIVPDEIKSFLKDLEQHAIEQDETNMNFTQQPYNRLNNNLVWISEKVKGQLIRFIVEEEPRIRLIADVASGASMYVYAQHFDSVSEAFLKAKTEFKAFQNGESLDAELMK